MNANEKHRGVFFLNLNGTLKKTKMVVSHQSGTQSHADQKARGFWLRD